MGIFIRVYHEDAEKDRYTDFTLLLLFLFFKKLVAFITVAWTKTWEVGVGESFIVSKYCIKEIFIR